MNPNGSWTLFFADMSAGEQSQVVSWELDISAVPEPVNIALAIFGAVALLVGLGSGQLKRVLERCSEGKEPRMME